MAGKRKRKSGGTKKAKTPKTVKRSAKTTRKPVKRSTVPKKPARKGFSKVTRLPSRVVLEAVEEKIHGYLSRWQERLLSEVGRDLDARILTHANRDGSVNGQLLIASLPRGIGAAKITLYLSETEQALKGGFWISTTMRFSFRDDEELYRRFRGMQEVTTYPQDAAHDRKIDLNLSTARGIMEKVKRRRRANVQQLAINIIWTHDKRRPAKRKPGGKERSK